MKEMFYLTTHSTYFIYGYMASDIWLGTTKIMGLPFQINVNTFYIHHPTNRITHTTALLGGMMSFLKLH